MDSDAQTLMSIQNYESKIQLTFLLKVLQVVHDLQAAWP
jgi:hypothetical protein